MRPADAEDGKLRVVQGLGLVIGLARQHIRDMGRTEALARGLHRLDHPFGLRRAIDEVDRVKADITVAAGL